MIDPKYGTSLVAASAPFRFIAESASSTRKKIEGFADLPHGWHYGEGGPLPKEVRDIGLELLDEMMSLGLTRTDAFPGQNGELMVTAYHGGHYLEAMIEIDGTQRVVHEIDDDEVWAGEGRAKELLRRRAKEIFGAVWHSSDWFILSTMMPHSVASRAWPSETLPIEAELRSSMPPAWLVNSA